jgi:predicted acetyltransferase
MLLALPQKPPLSKRGESSRRVLVTCDETNTGSKKIIEYNGGVFENAVEAESPIKKLRYWIDID